eukprot:gene18376-13210_t
MSFFFGSTAKKSVPPKVFVPQNKLKSTSAPSSQSTSSETAIHSAKEGELTTATSSSITAFSAPSDASVAAATSAPAVDDHAAGAATIPPPARAQPVKIGIGVGASRGFAPNVASHKPSIAVHHGAALSSVPSSSSVASLPATHVEAATGQKPAMDASVGSHRSIPTPSATTTTTATVPQAAPSIATEADDDDDQLGRGRKRRKVNTPSPETLVTPAIATVSSSVSTTTAPATAVKPTGGSQSAARANHRKRSTATAAAASTAPPPPPQQPTPSSSSSSSSAHLLPVNTAIAVANTAPSSSSGSGPGHSRRSSSHHGAAATTTTSSGSNSNSNNSSKALRKIERPLFPLAAYGSLEKFSRHTVYVRLPAPGLNGIEGIRLTNVDDRAVVTAIQPITPQTPVALKYLHQIELYDIVLAVNHLDARYASFDQILMALGRTQSAPVGVQDTYVLDDGRQVSGRELLLTSTQPTGGVSAGLDPLGAGLGLGSVGSGVWALLQSQASLNGVPGVIARGSLKNATIDSIARVVFARMPRQHPHSPA